MDRATLARYIDNTLLKPSARPDQIEAFCYEAKDMGFAAVVINPLWARMAADILHGSQTKVGCTIGFPLGATTKEAKAFETAQCLDNGCQEVDMVMNIGSFLAGDFELVKQDIATVKNAILGKYSTNTDVPLLKVILETCYLSREQIQTAAKLAVEAGADFVKTSTGFAKGGATIEAVRVMRQAVGSETGVKAAGGIRSLDTALAMMEAGANRIGTSSGAKILSELG